MRKSAAPSVNKLPCKRKKFSTPFTGTSSVSVLKDELPRDNNENKPEEKPESESSKSQNLPVQSSQKFQHKPSLVQRSQVQSTQPPKRHVPQFRSSQLKKTQAQQFKNDSTQTQMPLAQSSQFQISKGQSTDEKNEKYYTVVWCKASNKKHKVWEGDGVIAIKNNKSVTLYDTTGNQLGQGAGYKAAILSSLEDGSILKIGAKEIEIQEELTKDDFVNGKCFTSEKKEEEKIEQTSKNTSVDRTKVTYPSKSSQQMARKKLTEPRHNPNDVNALVMPRPKSPTQQIIDVVVDPYIASKLRSHQREGLLFLYECVMGYRTINNNQCGCILADDMGLGKTLQCIALVWTLLKQGPYGYPAVKNVIIVTPSSLVKNWQKEFTKWLGSERITPYVADTNNRVDEFLLRVKDSVLIIGYEMFVRCKANIEKAGFDLIICDEAHRLKNANVKTSTLINSLGIEKRILLTGTPIQNNLQELYALCELAIPGIFGSAKSFKQTFIDPIMEGEEQDCSEDEKEISQSISSELTELVSQFCLRRTSDITQGHLPTKVEYVVFLQMTALQRQLYSTLVGESTVQSYLRNDDDTCKYLECINALRQLCNHPNILYESARSKQDNYRDLLEIYDEEYLLCDETFEDSCKIHAVKNLLINFKETKDKVVIVANSTKALGVIEKVCKWLNITSARLDGQTPSHARQNLVDQFNSNHSNIMVFLLSCKAGGVGLNLTGASNLIMYDIDWNPAHDNQAMARIWREGQRHITHIYRLLVVGSIEEKMYQRQISKQNISGTVLDSLTSKRVRFSTEELKDLFQLKESETCCTLDLLRGSLLSLETDTGRASASNEDRKSISISQLLEWEHLTDISSNPNLAAGIRNSSCVSCVFRNQTSARS